ncbi:MAG: hypothetical protein WAT23_05600 [Chromatiaceae bacterium]
MTDLSKISSALAGLSGEISGLWANIETNKRSRDELAAQPLCKADVLAALRLPQPRPDGVARQARAPRNLR